jgi:GxxExxY protein
MRTPEMDQDKSRGLRYRVIGCAMEVHRHLGPGLLESLYEECLCDEFSAAGLGYTRQQALPVIYKGKALNGSYRVDIVVEDELAVEIKSVNHVLPVHEAQLHTYLRLSGLKVGLLINFHTDQLKAGIRRVLAPDAVSWYAR